MKRGWMVAGISTVLVLGSMTSITWAGTTTSPLIQQSVTLPNAAGPDWAPEPASYGITEEQNVPIQMSDGTILLADIYRPADSSGQSAAGTFPVILTQTPYRKTGTLTTSGDGYYPYLIQRGYINVIVDVRGTGSSEGTWEMFGPREVQDGVELVNWCAHNLSGSNGIVGLAGDSYLGINQLLVAGAVGKNSPLKAIFPVIAANDIYRDTAFQGGIPDTEFSIPWLALRGTLDMFPADNTQTDPTEAAQIELQHAGGSVTAFDGSFLTNVETGGAEAYDETWWQVRNPRSILQNIVNNQIPAFLVGGWFDIFQHGELLNYTGLQNAYNGLSVSSPMTAGEKATGRYQLVMGPWYHLTATQGPELQILQLAWFDRWLKGENTGIDKTSTPLHLYELNQNQWLDTGRWPVDNSNVQTYYFNGGHSGTAVSLNDGTLTSTAPTSLVGTDTLPWTDVNIPFGRSTDQWAMGATTYAMSQFGQPPVLYTQDDAAFESNGLTYTTDPFQEGKILAGPINVTLYATSTAPDTEFVATVEDVKPDGQAYPLTSGALLGSFRAIDTQQSWYQNNQLLMAWHPYTTSSQESVPIGQVTRYDVEVFPTFAYIAPGDRLRVTVTSSDEPHLTPTPAQIPNLLGGIYEIQHNIQYTSSINIPFAPADAFTRSSTIWGPSGQ